MGCCGPFCLGSCLRPTATLFGEGAHSHTLLRTKATKSTPCTPLLQLCLPRREEPPASPTHTCPPLLGAHPTPGIQHIIASMASAVWTHSSAPQRPCLGARPSPTRPGCPRPPGSMPQPVPALLPAWGWCGKGYECQMGCRTPATSSSHCWGVHRAQACSAKAHPGPGSPRPPPQAVAPLRAHPAARLRGIQRARPSWSSLLLAAPQACTCALPRPGAEWHRYGTVLAWVSH